MTGSGLGEVIEFYASREEAEQALHHVLADVPEWLGELGVVPVVLGEAHPC